MLIGSCLRRRRCHAHFRSRVHNLPIQDGAFNVNQLSFHSIVDKRLLAHPSIPETITMPKKNLLRLIQNRNLGAFYLPMLFSELNEIPLKNLPKIVLLKVNFGALQKGVENALLFRRFPNTSVY